LLLLLWYAWSTPMDTAKVKVDGGKDMAVDMAVVVIE
jgi:hypothetical protein